MMNFTVYHLLISLVNLLRLPLEKGTYVPRRSQRLTVFTRDLDELKLLKTALDRENPEAIRAYLLAVKGILFEIGFLLEQDPDLQKNPDFFEALPRLETLLHNAGAVEDFGEIADVAYRLSILLPFYVWEETLDERRAQLAEFERQKERRTR